MLKQDWLEYFEAVNGRSATDAEIAQALLAGEFVEPEVANAHQVGNGTGSIISDSVQVQRGVSNGEYYAQPQNSFQEQNGQTPFTQPTGQQYQELPQQQQNLNQFANQTQSFAQQGYPYQQPNGGQPNQFVSQPQSSGSQGQFNGQDFQQGPQAYYSQQQPAQPSEFSKTMKGFWAWLVSAWKSPTSEVESSKLNGYLSLGLTVFFAAIVVNYNFYNIISSVSFGFYSGPTFDFRLFLVSLIAAALVLFSIILGGFAVKRMVYKDGSFSFNKAFDWYGRLYAIVLPFVAFSALFSLLGIMSVSLFLAWIGLVLIGVGATFALIYSKSSTSMDPFYKYLMAIIVNGVITFIFTFIAFSLLMSLMMM
ncbi:DUF6574 domain-containing protein [Streptococcus cristatus]|uniref:DUF6574 domain-containing protein n=1 Tax=Streptococcus cristatus TaxID=45634 RepID=UPI0007836603|nr:DUF6574 domain-containing protein [Streptococcus cristatus]